MSDLVAGPSGLDMPPATRALSAENLRGLADMLETMPAPGPAEPWEILLATHQPDGDEVFGTAHWWTGTDEWLFVARPVESPPEDVDVWTPEGGPLPAGSDPDQEKRP